MYRLGKVEKETTVVLLTLAWDIAVNPELYVGFLSYLGREVK